MKYFLMILLVTVAAVGFVYKDTLKVAFLGTETSGNKKKIKDEDDKAPRSPEVSVIKTWNLPKRLKEISGITYLDENRFACVQDEEGVMFVYNTATEKVEKEISFGEAGDYEGIAVAGANAYILRSDGVLIEIKNWNTKPAIEQLRTTLTAKHNVEGLTYDPSINRLLLAIKDEEPHTKDYKGIYGFDLNKKAFSQEPIYKIDAKAGMIANGKKTKQVKPSAIAVHPLTKEVYIVDGPSSRLIILTSTGTTSKIYELGSSMEQPEGITFSPKGDMFISNEGVKQPGNISRVQLQP